jgi:hypothetical protein
MFRRDGVPPHPRPLSAGRLPSCVGKCGGEGVEKLKEAGGLRPPASLKTSPLPRLASLVGGLENAGGGAGVGGGWDGYERCVFELCTTVRGVLHAH